MQWKRDAQCDGLDAFVSGVDPRGLVIARRARGRYRLLPVVDGRRKCVSSHSCNAYYHLQMLLSRMYKPRHARGGEASGMAHLVLYKLVKNTFTASCARWGLWFISKKVGRPKNCESAMDSRRRKASRTRLSKVMR